ncbi:substrate-binding domain-containing protein [Phytoactinopolyspora halotolerans]|uniref:Sugar ABC transporter substrate-binding protein n=1 Tax=Phytoactinopolyspora halotolerans TaxID=1981512 RepID=A0A6L9SHZ9_9ACTN|nr:substrate-binding domain-containing protein [Phytoactinopolyspora halotolerans]NEE03700.1 sugar ABC transporter substrate-binding protein [Phytoactinopolyspora halotolerans]
MRRTRTRPRAAATSAVMFAVLAVAGCSASDDSASASAQEGTSDTEPMVVGVTTLFPTGTLAEFAATLEAEGPKHNMVFDIQDVSNDAAKEDRFMSAFATKKVDLVMASVVSPTGSVAALNRLKTAGVPVICYNTCVNAPDDQELTEAFVTNDQKELGTTTGEAAARYIEENLGGSATVAYLTCETYEVCQQRREGLDEALSAVDADVVAAQEGFVVDKATPVATSILAANPDLDVFIAENEDGVIAAANAIRARGNAGKTVVFGIGINPTVADLLLEPDGVVQQVTGQDARTWALESIEIARAIRDGEDPGEYYHLTPGPSFDRADPEPIREYLDVRD